MRLESEIRDGVLVLRLKGRFVTGSNAEVVSARKQLHGTDVANAVVDLGEVPYIDSTGLAFLVDLYDRLPGPLCAIVRSLASYAHAVCAILRCGPG